MFERGDASRDAEALNLACNEICSSAGEGVQPVSALSTEETVKSSAEEGRIETEMHLKSLNFVLRCVSVKADVKVGSLWGGAVSEGQAFALLVKGWLSKFSLQEDPKVASPLSPLLAIHTPAEVVRHRPV